MEYVRNFKERIETLIENKMYIDLRNVLASAEPEDIAWALNELEKEEYIVAYRLLPKGLAADVFVEMEPEAQANLIATFSDAEVHNMIEGLYTDDAADILEEMPANVVRRLLENASPETRRVLNSLLKYPENSAGSMMMTEYISLRPDMTADEAIEHIRQYAIDSENVYTCYVIKSRRLVGVISLRELLLMDRSARISNFMITNVISVQTGEDREHAAALFSRYGFIALPVVDAEKRLLGIITVDDAMDVIQEETEEDFAKMAAIAPTDKPYLRTSSFRIWLSRIPWLLLLMVSATFTGMIITGFESALAAQVVLTSFIPMLMGTGGNSGSQASVTVIRGISLGEIEFRDIARVIWKEIKVSVLCGLTLSVATFVKILLVDKLLLNVPITILVAAVVCIALLFTVIVAKVIGCSLPMLAKKVGFDPAVMASPFITTIVDAVSLLIYFGFAKAILGV